MSYHGLIPHCKHFLSSIPHAPSVLEIGVDRGVTLISLAVFLARTRESFACIGIDVNQVESTILTLANIDVSETQAVNVIIGNSLSVLPELVKNGMKFDLVLLDGDHNYYTVSRELVYINDLCRSDKSIIVIDDYDGKWGERDLWYAEREEYVNNSETTSRVETQLHGVKPAVDEFVKNNPTWLLAKPMTGEPVVLVKRTCL